MSKVEKALDRLKAKPKDFTSREPQNYLIEEGLL